MHLVSRLLLLLLSRTGLAASFGRGRPLLLQHEFWSRDYYKNTKVTTTKLHADNPSATTPDRNANFETAIQEFSSSALYKLPTTAVEMDQLIGWLRKGKLNLFPDYQRGYVWKIEKASRLIVTVLGNRFVPVIVLHEKAKGIYDVVDGKQRLTSLLSWHLSSTDPGFLKEKGIHVFKELRFSKDEEDYVGLEGCSYADLQQDRKNAFEAYMIYYMCIPFDTPEDDVYDVYTDINSGGEDLSAQQVRRAAFPGPFVKLLGTLAAQCEDFQRIYSPTSFERGGSYEPDTKKEADQEMILRALAMRLNGKGFKPPMKRFLNQAVTLKGLSDQDKAREAAKRKDEFEKVMDLARKLFLDPDTREECAFRKWNDEDKKWDKKIKQPLWDVLYPVLAELLFTDLIKPVQLIRCSSKIVEAIKTLCKDGELDNFKMTTANFSRLHRRIKDALLDAAGIGKEKRFFERADIPLLFERQHGKCGLCGQLLDRTRIFEGDYVHVDHILPYSKGGKTSLDNGQLTHRECNLSKGANSNGDYC